jgi:hypothetical protein
MFYLKVFITIFGFISVLVTPLIGLANSKQPPVIKQSESVEIVTGLTQLAQGDRKMIVQKYCIKGDIFH